MAIITLGANAITALPAGVGGKVLQVVETRSQSVTSTNGNGMMHITGSITPSSTSSKILARISFSIGNTTNGSGNAMCQCHIRRNSTDSVTSLATVGGNNVSSNREGIKRITLEGLDTPNTTSSTSYGIYLYNVDGATYNIGAWGFNATWKSESTVTLIEIAG
jgi:Tfp pilus assembly major pilin PilA